MNQNYKKLIEVILISEFMNLEIRITSTFRPVCQAGRLPRFHFEKPLLSMLHAPAKNMNIKTCSTKIFFLFSSTFWHILDFALLEDSSD